MPSLFRFLLVVAVLAGVAYGALVALATLVTPETRTMEQVVPAARLNQAPTPP